MVKEIVKMERSDRSTKPIQSSMEENEQKSRRNSKPRSLPSTPSPSRCLQHAKEGEITIFACLWKYIKTYGLHRLTINQNMIFLS